MKLAVVTVGYYDTDYDEKLKRLLHSCQIFNIDLKVMRKTGGAFNFFEAKLEHLGNFINNLRNDFTHVLYTDAADSFFLAGLSEIIYKYEKLGKPDLIVSGEKGCHPFGDESGKFANPGTPYRYLNPGNFLGKIQPVLDAISVAKSYYWLNTNDQGHWMRGYLDGKIPLVIDSQCELFQTMSDCDFNADFTMATGRIWNRLTKTTPCIAHFNGPKDQSTENFKNMDRLFEYVRRCHTKK